ncbi:MAG: hypothetical protein EA405_09120 [Rhodospirillales bacterium]|nr:MAG: hypothetical protein EA405_09120 [Rhodospirillales bacterium]
MANKPEDVQEQAGDQGETTVVDMTRAGAAEAAGAAWDRFGAINQAPMQAVATAFEMMVNSGAALHNEWTRLAAQQYRECAAFADQVTGTHSVMAVMQLQSTLATRLMHETMTSAIRMADVGRAACQDVWTSADKHLEATTGAGTPAS